LLLDPATLRNLEIFSSSRGTRDGTLLHAMNRTITAAGARLLERWLAAPTLEVEAIRRRQQLVGELLAHPTRLAEFPERLGTVRDIPRILGGLQNRLRNPRELGGVRDTLAQIPALKTALAAFQPGVLLATVSDHLQELPAVRQRLGAALSDELP